MKLKVGIVFGGRSAEHEVSVQSARNVIDALDSSKYEAILIGIDREGRWYLNDASSSLLDASDPQLLGLNGGKSEVKAKKQVFLSADGESSALVQKDDGGAVSSVDVLFPVLHGPYGEDGSIQGLAKLANLPCVGANILGSAIGMDKDVAKRLLRDAGIDVVPYRCYRKRADLERDLEGLCDELGEDLFVKPANLGSSVGISHVKNRKDLVAAADLAFGFDTKILVEKALKCREIEVSVLGNEEPIASLAGEIVVNEDFYSYEAKYIDENGARLEIPAKFDRELHRRFQDLAVRGFRTLELMGMARMDFFLDGDGRIYINEVNTIPGFTKISMFPKLWEASGIGYTELVDRLIQLALEEDRKVAALKNKRS